MRGIVDDETRYMGQTNFFLFIPRRLLFQVSATSSLGANLVSWCVEYSATTLAFMSQLTAVVPRIKLLTIAHYIYHELFYVKGITGLFDIQNNGLNRGFCRFF